MIIPWWGRRRGPQRPLRPLEAGGSDGARVFGGGGGGSVGSLRNPNTSVDTTTTNDGRPQLLKKADNVSD